MNAQEVKSYLVKSGVVFYDNDYEVEQLRHTYWYKGRALQGITGTLVDFAFPEKAEDRKNHQKQVDEAAVKGSAMHNAVETYENELLAGNPFPACDDINVQQWLRFKEQYNIEVLATEWIVSDNKHFASAIDILALVNGELSIIDLKHTYKPDLDSTALQTSIYRYFMLLQNKSLEVKHQYICWLREEQSDFRELYKVSDRRVRKLMKAYLTGDESYTYSTAPEFYGKALENRLARALRMKAKADAEVESLKAQLQESMISACYKSVKSEILNISYVDAKQSSRFDMASLKKDNPELAAELTAKYSKISTSKPYITIKLK